MPKAAGRPPLGAAVRAVSHAALMDAFMGLHSVFMRHAARAPHLAAVGRLARQVEHGGFTTARRTNTARAPVPPSLKMGDMTSTTLDFLPARIYSPQLLAPHRALMIARKRRFLDIASFMPPMRCRFAIVPPMPSATSDTRRRMIAGRRAAAFQARRPGIALDDDITIAAAQRHKVRWLIVDVSYIITPLYFIYIYMLSAGH